MTIAAGFKFLHVGQTLNGYLVGGLELADDSGDTVAMHRLEGAQTAPISVVEDEQLTVLGDDGPLVTFEFEGATLPAGVIEMAARDADFEALAQGTKVQQLPLGKLGALQPKGGSRPSLTFLMQRHAKTWAPGDRANEAWEILVALGTRARPLGATITQRVHNPYRYSLTTSKVARPPWGAPFTIADNGATAMPLFVFDSDKPIILECALGDGTQDEFTLVHQPWNDLITGITVWVNGVLKTQTTHYTYAAGVVTFTGGNIPADDAFIEFMIKVNESDLET